jgi:hypothetical protein
MEAVVNGFLAGDSTLGETEGEGTTGDGETDGDTLG